MLAHTYTHAFQHCFKHSPARAGHPPLVRSTQNWSGGRFFLKKNPQQQTNEKSDAKSWHISDKKLWRMGAAISNTVIDEPSNKLLQTNNSGPDPEGRCLPTHPHTTQNMHCTAYCVWNHRNSLSHTMIGTIHHKLETRPLFQSCTWGLKSNVTIFIITGAKVFCRKNYLCRQFVPTNGAVIWLGSSSFQRKNILFCLSRNKSLINNIWLYIVPSLSFTFPSETIYT